MSKKELVMKIFEELGYKPQEDGDGDIMTCYQMKMIYAIIGDETENYLSLMLPKFYEIEEGEEALVLAICNKVTRELKLGKIYIDQTFKGVSASCEFYYTDEDSLKLNIIKSLHILGFIRTVYWNTKKNLSE